MYTFIQKFHSGWAYLALLLIVVAVVNSIVGLSRKKEFSANDRKMGLFALVFTHVQLLIGLILYFISPKGYALISQVGMGTVMKTAELRLTVIEHPITNILAILFITIGWSKHKKASTSEAKFKSIAIFYAIGLVLLLSRIPWQSWLQ
ncbi:hypothetical protein [Flavobacterium caeni]|uniref:50S ribosomal protein L27 n=1 Tax=Flavobacterium caeni TaxID=490189 RepID=A0A1G5H1S8_9FLAO|nr:hypothetical protein [Flavobacterium caeni]SCY57320.1 hypothetical protein SAMN02927903_01713 [Flavobacterium caeni]